jgi:hypothetical protein
MDSVLITLLEPCKPLFTVIPVEDDPAPVRRDGVDDRAHVGVGPRERGDEVSTEVSPLGLTAPPEREGGEPRRGVERRELELRERRRGNRREMRRFC